MKKLGVILLAMAFVFGLAAQASAVELVEPEVVKEEDKEKVFGGDMPIMFEGIYCETPDSGIEITDQYELEFGVTFSGGLYQESFFSPYYMLEDGVADWDTASNINDCQFGVPAAPVVTVTFDAPVTRVGFNGRSPGGDIILTVFRGGIASDPIPFDTRDGMKFIGIEDPKGIDEIEISGSGLLYWHQGAFFIDEFRSGGVPATGPAEIEVIMNVKPLNCAGASINVKSKGVTPVVIVGTEDLDVTMIDLSSVELQGAAPVRSAVEDVANCKSPGLDGYPDLVLKFDTQELVRGMQASQKAGVTLENDDWPLLRLTGSLSDGTLIYADQVVSVKGKAEEVSRGKQKGKK